MASVQSGSTVVAASNANGLHSRFDPNQPVTDLLHVMEDRRDAGELTEDQILLLDNEEPYVPLRLAELRVTALVNDMNTMKDNHLTRMKDLQGGYDDMLRGQHKLASDMLEKARDKAGERIKFYKDKTQEINKQLVGEKKNMEKQQRKNDKEIKRLKDLIEDLLKAKKSADNDLESKGKLLDDKHEEVLVLSGKITELEKAGKLEGGVASQAELVAAQTELAALQSQLDDKAKDVDQLESSLTNAEAELVRVKALVGSTGGAEMIGLMKDLDDAKALIPVLESEKEKLTTEIIRLNAVVIEQNDDSAQVNLLKEKLTEAEQARRMEADKFRTAAVELEEKAEQEKDEALTEQRELYDKMIKQMIKGGKEKEVANKKKDANAVIDNRIADAQREADEAKVAKETAERQQHELEGKFKYCDERLKEIAKEMAANENRLNVVVPEHATLAEELENQIGAKDEHDRRNERVATYTEDDGRAQMAKFGLDWDHVNGPLASQLLDVCKHYSLMKALQDDLYKTKEQHDEVKVLAKSPDLDISGPAKVKAKELAAQFNNIKADIKHHNYQWDNLVNSLGLKSGGLQFDKDDDFDQLTLAADMWHEIMKKDPSARKDNGIRGSNGAVIPENLEKVMREFNLDPATVDNATIAKLEDIVTGFNDHRGLLDKLKTVRNDFEDKKARAKTIDDNNQALKDKLAEAKAEGKDDAELQDLQQQIEANAAESAVLRKEAKALYEVFTKGKPELKAMQDGWKENVTALGLESPEHQFEQVGDFELLTYIANEFKDWNERHGDVSERGTVADDVVNGPDDELREKVKKLSEEKVVISNDQDKLSKEKATLLKEKEEYENKHQMAALASLAANKEMIKKRKNLKTMKEESGETEGGEAQEEAKEGDVPEADLTGGNVILLDQDIAETHKELLDAKFALAQAQKQSEVYKQQIHEERERHQKDIEWYKNRIKELEDEIDAWHKKEVQWKVSAGTFYAKAGIAGQQNQSDVGHAYQTENLTDETAKTAIEELKARLVKAEKDLEGANDRERAALTRQRQLEAGGAVASEAGDASSGSAAVVVVAANGDNDELVQQNTHLQTQLKDSQSKAQGLQAELDAVKSQLKTMEKASSGSSSELQGTIRELSDKLSKVETELANTKNELHTTTETKNKDIFDKAAIIIALEAAKVGLTESKTNCEQRIKELEEKLAACEADLKAKNDDLTNKIAEIVQLNEEIERLRKQLLEQQEEMKVKMAQQEADANAALAALQAQADEVLAKTEAKAKADMEVAAKDRDVAIEKLGVEVNLKEDALADGREKAAKISELNVNVDDLTKLHAVIENKFIDEQERRKYFQQEYEAAKGKIRVYARVRPFIRLEKESKNPIAQVKCVHPGPNAWTALLNIQKHSVQENKIIDDWQQKTFDHIFLSGYEEQFGKGADNGSQAQVFNECEGFAEMAFDGLNTCIFAYGQSGSGKTWTMRGSTTDPVEWGLKPRMINHMFELQKRAKSRYDSRISCSMFEIYNDEIQDIFERTEQVEKWELENKKCYKCYSADHRYTACTNCAKCRQSGHSFSLCKSKQVGKFYLDRFEPPLKKLEVKVLGNQRVSVPGLQTRECTSFDEMQKLCDEAELLRRVRATGLNDESSRSHLIFSIYVEKKEKNPKDKKAGLPTFGKQSLCDLAGSEKVERTQMASDVSEADRKLMIEEGKRINTSLSVLTSIFSALGQKLKPGEKRQLPRYRENLLTNVMQDSIGGNARTQMFVNVSPSLMNIEETKQTLGYADLVQNITNTIATSDVDVEQYLDRIADLEEKIRILEGKAPPPPPEE